MFTVIPELVGALIVITGASQFLPITMTVLALVPQAEVAVNTKVFIPGVKVIGATNCPFVKLKFVIETPLCRRINSLAVFTFWVEPWKVKLPVLSVRFELAGLVIVTTGAMQGV